MAVIFVEAIVAESVVLPSVAGTLKKTSGMGIVHVFQRGTYFIDG
ncbi:hypothetical protein [Xylella fastidiosa]|nr:hypothetical protein [Xylella fastidiosa]